MITLFLFTFLYGTDYWKLCFLGFFKLGMESSRSLLTIESNGKIDLFWLHIK